MKSTDAVLDVGSGYCEFINHIDAREKIALDLNPVAQLRALSDVKVVLQDVSQSWAVEPDTMDVVFSSNFFEHLSDKTALGR